MKRPNKTLLQLRIMEHGIFTNILDSFYCDLCGLSLFALQLPLLLPLLTDE
jgi:hypothetical protein